MSEERKFKWVGTRPIRHDGVDKVTGRANYGADLSLPGMLWGKVLRSPHAHARIVSIDAEPALKIDGVYAAITAADLLDPGAGSGQGGEGPPVALRDMADNILAREKVLYDGHAVAAVAATSARLAEQALRAIRVEYEELHPVLDVDQASAPNAPILHEDMRTQGMDPKPEGPTNVAQRNEMTDCPRHDIAVSV